VRRIFLDSSVLIAACGSMNGASHTVIVMAEIGLFKVLISKQVLEECERNISKKMIAALPIFRQILMIINLEITPDPLPQDIDKYKLIIEPKDAPILASAIAANADRILSLNTKDFNETVSSQCGLMIQTPSQFIQEIRSILAQEL
jgi:predicted nucleic acid-binding protein